MACCPGRASASTSTCSPESSHAGAGQSARAGAPRVLDHHHRVRAVRDRRAGRDLDAVAGRERAGERLRRVGAADQPQHLRDAARGAGDVRRAHRVAVHRRAVERRLIHRRDDVLGQHAAVRHVERDRLVPHQRRDRLADQAPRLVERDGVGKRAHGHRVASRTRCPSSGSSSFSTARRTACSEPGRHTRIARPTRPAQARDSIAAAPISW